MMMTRGARTGRRSTDDPPRSEMKTGKAARGTVHQRRGRRRADDLVVATPRKRARVQPLVKRGRRRHPIQSDRPRAEVETTMIGSEEMTRRTSDRSMKEVALTDEMRKNRPMLAGSHYQALVKPWPLAWKNMSRPGNPRRLEGPAEENGQNGMRRAPRRATAVGRQPLPPNRGKR